MNTQNFDSQTGREAIWKQMDKELQDLIDPSTGKVNSEIVQHIPCPVCDLDDASPVFSKMGFDFVRCNHCETLYVNPQLQDDRIMQYYRRMGQDKTSERSSSAMWIDVLSNRNNQAWQVPYFEEALSMLEKHIPSQGKILDLGCSIGLFMEVAQKKGHDCIGLELEPEAHQYALSRGLNVLQQTLEEADFSSETFDAITMFGVLEHLQNPKKILRQIWDCLKPGGVVMAIVPNAYSLAGMTLHSNARMFNGRNHLTYFSHRTLPLVLQKAGFTVVGIDTVLTGLDSIINYWQFNDPQGLLTLNYRQ